MPLLSPGDRFPDVIVHDAAGGRALYNRHRGGEVVVTWGGAYRELVAIEKAFPVTVMTLSDAPGSERWIAASRELRRAITDDSVNGALLLDASLRVRERLFADNYSTLAKALSTVAPVTQGLRGTAPALLIPRVLEPSLVDELLAHFRVTGGAPSGVLHYDNGSPVFRLDPDVKMRREAVLSAPDLERRVHDRVMNRVLPEIDRAFAYQVRNREHFKIIAYQAGAGYFRAHRDNDASDVAHRKFAMTLNLNTGHYTGGCLKFPEYGPHLYEAEAGGALVFSCSLLHEATDVETGERLALTSFFY